MPAPALAEVHAAAVAPVRLADAPAQGLLGRRDEDQMDVVGHQAVGPYADAVGPRPLAQQGQVGPVVVVAEEGLHPAIPALRDARHAVAAGEGG